MTPNEFRKLALSFPGTEENPHFDRAAFKITKRRIFATMHEASNTVNIMLTPIDQSVFCAFDKKNIYPLPNKWGQQGVTTFEIKNLPKDLIKDALSQAYAEAAVKKKK